MTDTQAYFENLLDLVEIELAHDKEQYFQQLQKFNAGQRRAKGLSWFPLNILESSFSLGQIPSLIVSRTKMLDMPHQFRSGSQVELFAMDDKEAGRIKGLVNWVQRDKMKLLFTMSKLPDWVFKSSIGIDLYFDERTYRVMLNALAEVANAKNCRLAELREKLLIKSEPKVNVFHAFNFDEYLNESQNDAALKALGAEDYAVIHGPPGTGKTTTLVSLIKQIPFKELPVLVCAPSNAAVDHLALKLSEGGLNVLRIGNLSRMKDEIWHLTIESRIDNHPDTASIKKMKKQAAEIRKQAGKYRRNFSHEERLQRKNLYAEAKDLSAQIKIAEDYLVHKLINQAEVIATTLVGSESRYLEKMEFETLVIDEAAQALEPACWIPIRKCKRVIFAGDPFQLPPTVKSRTAEKKGLSETLMEKLVAKQSSVYLLNTQYRMNQNIMNITNGYFYNNELKADETVQFQKLNANNEDQKPVEFIDTAGSGYEEMRNPNSLSYYNPEEYNVIGVHLTKLLNKTFVTKPSIAIISPYKEQVTYIKDHLTDHFLPEQIALIQVDTVDAFQGQEKDVIYISMVRSNGKSEIGFLKDYRRMNVAVTRARKKLVIVGDSATIGNDPFYKEVLSYLESIAAYHSVWELL